MFDDDIMVNVFMANCIGQDFFFLYFLIICLYSFNETYFLKMLSHSVCAISLSFVIFEKI